jgi:hypothetical protein
MNKETKKGFDIYHSETVHKLSFKNRINILFNGYVRTSSVITVDKEVIIVESKGMLITKDIIPEKKGGLEVVDQIKQNL